MIVRDEAPNLRNHLPVWRRYFNHFIFGIDSQTKDDSADVILNILQDTNCSTVVYVFQFDDFGTAKSQLVEAAHMFYESRSYVLVAEPDQVPTAFNTTLMATNLYDDRQRLRTSFSIIKHGDKGGRRLSDDLLQNSGDWYYKFRVHETPILRSKQKSSALLTSSITSAFSGLELLEVPQSSMAGYGAVGRHWQELEWLQKDFQDYPTHARILYYMGVTRFALVLGLRNELPKILSKLKKIGCYANRTDHHQNRTADKPMYPNGDDIADILRSMYIDVTPPSLLINKQHSGINESLRKACLRLHSVAASHATSSAGWVFFGGGASSLHVESSPPTVSSSLVTTSSVVSPTSQIIVDNFLSTAYGDCWKETTSLPFWDVNYCHAAHIFVECIESDINRLQKETRQYLKLRFHGQVGHPSIERRQEYIETQAATAYYLGRLYREIYEDLDEAADWFNKALSVDPGFAWATEALARIHINVGNYSQGLLVVERQLYGDDQLQQTREPRLMLDTSEAVSCELPLLLSKLLYYQFEMQCRVSSVRERTYGMNHTASPRILSESLIKKVIHKCLKQQPETSQSGGDMKVLRKLWRDRRKWLDQANKSCIEARRVADARKLQQFWHGTVVTP